MDSEIIYPISKDGHCLFRCFSVFLHKLLGKTKTKDEIRKELCDYIEQNKDFFKDFFVSSIQEGGIDQESQETIDEHIANIKKGIGEHLVGLECYGNHTEIVAASEVYNLKVVVEENGKTFSIDPKKPNQDTKTIKLVREKNHYDLKLPESAFPQPKRELLVELFSEKNTITKLNLDPLTSINGDDIKLILDNKDKNIPLQNSESLRRAIGEVYGSLSKFYTENSSKAKNFDFSKLHYQIVFIGDTSAGKDSTLANVVEEDIGYSGAKLTTKFPERIIKQRSESGGTIYKFYKEGESEKSETYKSLKELNKDRMDKHNSYPSISFDTHAIEIHSSDPSTVPVTILNLPGFLNVDPNDPKSVGLAVYKGLESEIGKLVKTGIGSIYIIRKCKNTIENESWSTFFFGKNSTVKKEDIKDLDFVIVHTHSLENIYKFENGKIVIPNHIKTYDDLLKDLQYYDIEDFFKKFDKKPTQIFIENFKSDLNDYLNIKGDPNQFKTFLNTNDTKLLEKVDALEDYFKNLDPISNKQKDFQQFKSYFGINKLRKDYLEKISIPTSSQIDGLVSALYHGSKILQDVLIDDYQKIQTYHKSKLGETFYNLHKDFSQSRPIFSLDTSFQSNISQDDFQPFRDEISKTSIEEFKDLDMSKILMDLFENDKNKIKEWEKIISEDLRKNNEHFLDFKNASMRFKENLFELAKIIPLKELTEKEYQSITSHLTYSSKGQTKRDGLNLHVLQQLKKKIKQLAPFISRYISNLWYSRVRANFKLCQKNYETIDKELMESFSQGLQYIYQDQLQKVIEKDIEAYSEENFYLIDPSSLTIFNEVLQSAPETERENLREIIEKMYTKDMKSEELTDLKMIFKKEFAEENLTLNILKKFDVLKILPHIVQKEIENLTKENLESKQKQMNDLDIENNYTAACDYMKLAFRIQIKRSIDSMWNNSVMKNLNKFHIFSKDFYAETVWLLKISLMKLFTTKNLKGILEEYNDPSLKNAIAHSGNLSLKSNINTFLPPSELEKKAVQTNNLQGLVPYWEDMKIEAKLNSFYDPLTLNIQSFLLVKVNEMKFDKKPIIKTCTEYLENIKNLYFIFNIFEKINSQNQDPIYYYEDWSIIYQSVASLKENLEKELPSKVYIGGKQNSKLINDQLGAIFKK